MSTKISLFLFICYLGISDVSGQHSVAREWNDLLLESIRMDLARPTVHARNLWHTSVAMYDAWAVYDETSVPYFLGNEIDGYLFEWEGIPPSSNIEDDKKTAICYTMYRLLRHRFSDSDAATTMFPIYDGYMAQLGYDIGYTSTNYSSGSAAALGNYIAAQIIQFGAQDGGNEANDYENIFYEPVNPPLIMDLAGNPDIEDFNRWQPLFLNVFIDQSGNVIPGNSPDFLSPEWGVVSSFALKEEDLTTYNRDGFEYKVYHDPGHPPYLDPNNGALGAYYKWNFSLVTQWSSHLDPDDPTVWDISPASIGNIASLPTNMEELQAFYNVHDGGDASRGHRQNPTTGVPYEPQYVKRGDYARVLAEFWADGPDSETPPGHWFTLLNYVSDHPQFEKKFEGQGPVLTDIEWDVKAYFILGGAVHDAAVTAWGCKGWYDYIRPVSALRGMAELGQSSDISAPSYHEAGIPLDPGFIELVYEGDPLAGSNNQHVGKVKLKAWRGPDYISDPVSDIAGVSWILAESWFPYQRPTFVTPPFAGYVSGHSTFSRAAAEVMTFLTGDPFFPGGLGEFVAPQDNFLVFEKGPSQTVKLQWATYRDASDQCSLSRIWGGIHPPIDDIPGRLMGIEIGKDAFDLGKKFVTGEICDGTLNINEQPIEPQLYKAIQLINSSGEVATGSTVKFESQNVVDLKPGFTIAQNGNFSVQIVNCN